MAKNIDPIISFQNKSTDKAVNIYDLGGLREFIKTQMDAYQWITEVQNTNVVHDLRQHVFQPLYQSSNIASNQHLDAQSIAQVNYHLTETFSNYGLPTAETKDWTFLEEVRSRHDAPVAVVCLAFILNRMDHLTLSHKSNWIGLTLSVMREEGVSSSGTQSAKKHHDRLSEKCRNQITVLEKEGIQRTHDHSTMCEQFERRADIARRWQMRGTRIALAKAEADNQSAISELSDVRRTYEEMMKLKAPVDYWRDKAKEHRSESKRYRDTLLWHARWVAPSVLVSLLGVAALSFAFAQADKPFSAYLILVTIGVVITTMAFWAARIMVRFYMSEHHLAIDAEERATMAMTYLALIERGAADEKERALILAPLFRPSSDGIVKDDAAPDLSPAALLSKMLNK